MTILSIPPKKESYHTGIIAFQFDVVIIFFRHQRGQLVSLPEPKLKRQQTARRQMRRRRLDQSADNFVPALTAKERDLRIMSHFARKGGAIVLRNIRQI